MKKIFFSLMILLGVVVVGKAQQPCIERLEIRSHSPFNGEYWNSIGLAHQIDTTWYFELNNPLDSVWIHYNASGFCPLTPVEYALYKNGTLIDTLPNGFYNNSIRENGVFDFFYRLNLSTAERSHFKLIVNYTTTATTTPNTPKPLNLYLDATEHLILNSDVAISESSLRLFDTQGKLIWQELLNTGGGTMWQSRNSLQYLPTGVYIWQINDLNGLYQAGKILKP
jgi:hypothetical protein